MLILFGGLSLQDNCHLLYPSVGVDGYILADFILVQLRGQPIVIMIDLLGGMRFCIERLFGVLIGVLAPLR